MPSLRELQTGFMQALFAGAPAGGGLGITRRGIEAHLSLGIYANTARVNFVESLRTSFPVVLRLVGDAYFRQCALHFRERHPSRSGDLQQTGVGFSDFLAEIHAGDEFHYLSDVARLEWCCQEALTSAEHAPFRLEKLAALDPTGYEDVRFLLHPSLRLFSSEYPCRRIWEANVNQAADFAPIDLRDGADRLVIVRVSGHLRIHESSVGEFNFLGAIQAGGTFGTVVERTLELDAEFDAGAALRRFVGHGAIVDCVQAEHRGGLPCHS
jgi:hypothetical protein